MALSAFLVGKVVAFVHASRPLLLATFLIRSFLVSEHCCIQRTLINSTITQGILILTVLILFENRIEYVDSEAQSRLYGLLWPRRRKTLDFESCLINCNTLASVYSWRIYVSKYSVSLLFGFKIFNHGFCSQWRELAHPSASGELPTGLMHTDFRFS